MRIALVPMVWLSLCVAVQAAEVTVEITDAHGNPVPDAVLTLEFADGQTAPKPPAAQTKTIDQERETFIPYVEVFRPGDRVQFSNSDRTRHHVYSFSPAKRFEFVLRPGERSPPQDLTSVGTVAVGCNIHDRMVTYLHVSTAPWVARSDAKGQARLASLPIGEYALAVWHPRLRPGAAPAPRAVVLDSERARQHSSFALPLLPDPRDETDRERGDY